MKPHRPSSPRIALQIEKNRAHGRALLKGIADYALEHTDWRLELVDSTQLAKLDHVRQFDGLIVRVMDDATADVLARSRRPVVDAYGRKDDNRLASIRLDDRAIAETAYRCFEEHHYRAFAYCGFPGLRFSDARGTAFGNCAAANGFRFMTYAGSAKSRIPDKFFRDEKTAVPDAVALGKWLSSLPKPVAVFCCNDLRAVQVLNVCADNGIAVPRDVAVMGVDNDVLLCTFTNPSLSSIDTDPFALGRTAAEMLAEQMANERGGRRSRANAGRTSALHPPKRVVERLSTDAYPFKTQWMDEAIRYIRRNLAKGVTAEDVVAHIGYSHPTVNKAFVEELGHAVKKEILKQRARLACGMLRDTNCAVGEIAERCGYQRAPYFIYCFSEEFGMTPEAWRKKNRFQKP